MTAAGAEREADVVVVGAGPAGAATAILLAEHGLHVVVLDRARFPRPKICGEYLSPEAARVLDRLGVLKVVDGSAAPLRGMTITAPDGTRIEGTYRAIGRWAPYRQHAMSVPRLTLDAALADRVRALPVDFREQTRVTDLVRIGGRVAGVETRDASGRTTSVRARLVIGADGRSSVVAERLGCRSTHRLRRMALVTYVTGLLDCRERGEIFVDPPDYAIINPLAEGRANLSVVVPVADVAPYSDRLDLFFAARVKHLPHLARRLAGAERVEPVRALGPLAVRVARPEVDGVLLVGDARGFYDPFTGEGVFTALRGAELAAETAVRAIRSGDVSGPALAAYERARANAFRAKERVVHGLQFVIARRWLANRVAHALARRPALLDLVMGVIGDFVPPRALAAAVVRGRG
jgi:menaquinone-9 beta-reductase